MCLVEGQLRMGWIHSYFLVWNDLSDVWFERMDSSSSLVWIKGLELQDMNDVSKLLGVSIVGPTVSARSHLSAAEASSSSTLLMASLELQLPPGPQLCPQTLCLAGGGARLRLRLVPPPLGRRGAGPLRRPLLPLGLAAGGARPQLRPPPLYFTSSGARPRLRVPPPLGRQRCCAAPPSRPPL